MVALRRYRLLLAMAASFGLCAGIALGDEQGLYLGLSAGMNVPTTNAEARRDTDKTPEEIYEVFDYNLDHGYALSGSLGAYVGDFRVELQVAAQRNEIEDVESLGINWDIGGALTTAQVMGNVFYDIPLNDRLTAFIGAGAGVAQVWLRPDHHLLDDQSGMGLACQGILGIAWKIADGVSITADYRVWTTTDVDMDDVELDMPIFHMAEIGVRFSF